MSECYCTVCVSFIWVFHFKLFVLCHSSFVTFQSIYYSFFFIFVLLFHMSCLLFLCSVISTISPYAYCRPCPLCKTLSTTACGWKPNCSIHISYRIVTNGRKSDGRGHNFLCVFHYHYTAYRPSIPTPSS